MTPSQNDARIWETPWYQIPGTLLERKDYFSRLDNILYYISAERGICREVVGFSEEPRSIYLKTPEIPDNSAEQFAKLQGVLNKPA